jgi:cell division GTPase FtsZ
VEAEVANNTCLNKESRELILLFVILIHLQNSSVPNKIQLGVNLTEGLGAGANPDVGQQSAIESIADIEKLDRNTKMVLLLPEWVVVQVQGLLSNCTIS